MSSPTSSPTPSPASTSPTAEHTRAHSFSVKPIAWSGVLVSLVVLVISGYILAQRIGEYNKANARPIYSFIQGDKTDFTFRDRPVTIRADLNDAGEGEVLVTYADATLHLPVQIPQAYAFPGLERYADWFRVQMFAESSGMSFAEFEARINSGEIEPRLVIVTRNPHSKTTREGRFELEPAKNWGWGEVRRDKWTFGFYEFLPEGGFSTETLRFPESGASFYRRQVKADLAGDPPPERADDELREGSWQFQAALPLMNRRPGITTEQQGLRNAGWTLPAASASMIALMVFLAFALAPSREQVERRAINQS